MSSFTKSLFFSFFVLAASLPLSLGVHFDVTNNCPYTVWGAANPGGGAQLNSGQTWSFDVAAGTTVGRVWARTNCQFDGTGHGHCETGDCGGLLQCQGYGSPPNTLVEYSLNQFKNEDFIDLSVVDGFNVPIGIRSMSGGCNRVLRCKGNILAECPNELRVPGGCNGACAVFKTDQYCCTGGAPCNPTNYSKFFKDRCPQAYSYPMDDATSFFAFPSGSSFKVVVCP